MTKEKFDDQANALVFANARDALKRVGREWTEVEDTYGRRSIQFQVKEAEFARYLKEFHEALAKLPAGLTLSPEDQKFVDLSHAMVAATEAVKVARRNHHIALASIEDPGVEQ